MKFAGLPVNPLLLPVYFVQGKWTRLVTERLPDADGPATGLIAGREPALRLLGLGDSTIAGVGAQTHQAALTGQTAFHLSRQTQRAVQWQAIGQTSATSVIIRRHLVPRIQPNAADAVVISCGVNDVTRMHSPEQWQANLRALLQAVRERLGEVPILHAGVPPLGLFPAMPQPLRQWIGARALAFAEIAQTLIEDETCADYGCDLLPMAMANGFARDGYHPNENSYGLWGEFLARRICHTWPAFSETAATKPEAKNEQARLMQMPRPRAGDGYADS